MSEQPPSATTAGGPAAGDRAILTLRVGEASAEQVSVTVSELGAGGRLIVEVSDSFAGRAAPVRPGTLAALDCARPDGLWRVSAIVEEALAAVGGGTALRLGRPHDPRPADRRRYLRAHVRLPLRIGDEPEAVAYSIGAGGLAATVASAMEPGTRVTVGFDAGEVSVVADARVVWCEPVDPPGRSRVGAEFLALDDAAQDALLALVSTTRRRASRR
ncbi:MAG: PilZ domain-containing protein [Acidimicrobiia bacterium]|nr:PilZ domain-containing protein [Acidimicrobiia bacterium]